jgi:hypothetical protein
MIAAGVLLTSLATACLTNCAWGAIMAAERKSEGLAWFAGVSAVAAAALAIGAATTLGHA